MFIVKRIASHNGFPNKLYHGFSSNYTMPLRNIRATVGVHSLRNPIDSTKRFLDSIRLRLFFSLFHTISLSLYLFFSFSTSSPSFVTQSGSSPSHSSFILSLHFSSIQLPRRHFVPARHSNKTSSYSKRSNRDHDRRRACTIEKRPTLEGMDCSMYIQQTAPSDTAGEQRG